MDEIISIIVPVYKVETFLCQCVDSILAQTYRNIEVILVDDGSPDRCGAICDGYARRDSRVRVIHRENGGLSAARNTSMAAAQGTYLVFVDSDDWIEPDMFSSLYAAIQQSGKDIAQCNIQMEPPPKKQRKRYESAVTLSRYDALHQLLKDNRVQNYVWNKLYRRQCWEGIPFPEGKVYEDIYVMYRVFLQSNGLACVPRSLCHYRQNPMGISKSREIANMYYYLEGARERRMALQREYPEFLQLLYHFEFFSAVDVWSTVFRESKREKAHFQPMLERMAQAAKDNQALALSLKKAFHLHLGGRIQIELIQHARPWAYFLSARVKGLHELKTFLLPFPEHEDDD